MVKMQGNACKSAIRALFSRTERFRPRYTLTYRLRGMLYLVIVRSSPKTSRPEAHTTTTELEGLKLSRSQDPGPYIHIYNLSLYESIYRFLGSGLTLIPITKQSYFYRNSTGHSSRLALQCDFISFTSLTHF